VSDPVPYAAVLPVRESTGLFVFGLLTAERRRRGTRGRRRALGCYRHAVLVLRWFLDGTRLTQLAADNRIGRSTAYRNLHECIDVLAAAAPGLRGASSARLRQAHRTRRIDDVFSVDLRGCSWRQHHVRRDWQVRELSRTSLERSMSRASSLLTRRTRPGTRLAEKSARERGEEWPVDRQAESDHHSDHHCPRFRGVRARPPAFRMPVDQCR
jgi:hypothetical protein